MPLSIPEEGPSLPANTEEEPLLGKRSTYLNEDEETSTVKGEDGTAHLDTRNLYWREFVDIVNYAVPLIITNCLQFAIRLTSLLFVGRLGTIPLGAIALGGMTSNITGFAAIMGFAAALDTLCPEAFGAGKPHLVGLYSQRVFAILMIMSCFIAVLWIFSGPILRLVIPDKELVEVTASIMRYYIASLPGFCALEVGKRFIRSQGSAVPLLYFLIVGVPLNIFLHWLLIFHFGWGIKGAPISVAITQTVMPVLMVIFIRFTPLKQCWGGFTTRAFHNWWPILSLGFPDFLMVEIDVLSWEILALLSAYLSNAELAAQTALGSIMGAVFQVPFPVSIAGSFQIATAIGQKNVRKARCATRVVLVMGVFLGFCGLITLVLLRNVIPKLFSKDPEVLGYASALLPLLGVVQIFDSASIVSNGVLRGLGRQKIGGIAMICSYYIFGMPWAAGSAFGLGWRLYGLWSGLLLGTFGTFLVGVVAVSRLSFERCVERSTHRTTNA